MVTYLYESREGKNYILDYLLELIIKIWQFEKKFLKIWQSWPFISQKILRIGWNHTCQVKIWQKFPGKRNTGLVGYNRRFLCRFVETKLKPGWFLKEVPNSKSKSNYVNNWTWNQVPSSTYLWNWNQNWEFLGGQKKGTRTSG